MRSSRELGTGGCRRNPRHLGLIAISALAAHGRPESPGTLRRL